MLTKKNDCKYLMSNAQLKIENRAVNPFKLSINSMILAEIGARG